MRLPIAAVLAGLAAMLALTAKPAAADPAECLNVQFSDVGWTDITATTALASPPCCVPSTASRPSRAAVSMCRSGRAP